MVELRKYGSPGWWDLIKFTIKALIRVPLVVCSTTAMNIHNIFLNPAKFKRTFAINFFRQILVGTSPYVVQAIISPSLDCYLTWTKHHRMEQTVEDLIDDTILTWVGPKRRDRVILYIHGGAYLFPLPDYTLDYLRYVQTSLKDAGQDVGVVVLTYTLLPNAGFEVQLTQATRAVEHILASGVQPKDLHIAGDSAGAQLALAYFSHLLHPLNNVRKMKISQQIGSLFLMSPWCTFSTNSPSITTNANSDLFPVSASKDFAQHIIAAFASQPPTNPWTCPLDAPEGWFNGLDSLVDRVLITAGSKEVFRDDIKGLAERLRKEIPDLTLAVEEGGVHNDSFVDFMVGVKPTCSLTPLAVHWYVEGMKTLPNA